MTFVLIYIVTTVNSCYCGHTGDCDLVSVLARVGNSKVREKKIENVFAGFTVEENTGT